MSMSRNRLQGTPLKARPLEAQSLETCDESCPVARTARLIEGKWTTRIVRDLLTGKKRYSELQRSLVGISPKVLAERLRFLENEGTHRKNHLSRRSAPHRIPPYEAGSEVARHHRGHGALRRDDSGLDRWSALRSNPGHFSAQINRAWASINMAHPGRPRRWSRCR